MGNICMGFERYNVKIRRIPNMRLAFEGKIII
jgi:hypothetical protein